MNPITAALAETTSAHLSESGISVHTAYMSFFWSPLLAPASAPRPDQAHLHRLLAIHQAQSAPLFCAKCVPNRRTNPTRYNSKPITYSGSVHSLVSEALRPEHLGAPRASARRSASDTRLLNNLRKIVKRGMEATIGQSPQAS